MDDSTGRKVIARFYSPSGLVLMGGIPEECIIRSRCPIMEGDKIEVMEIMSEEERTGFMATRTEEENKEYFTVTRTCKKDMRHALAKRIQEINQLTDDEMKHIAGKLADDYMEQLYWSSLEIITEDYLDYKETSRLRQEYRKANEKRIEGGKDGKD